MRTPGRWLRAAALTSIIGVLVPIAGCSSADTPKPVDAASVYTAVVAWFGARSSADPDPLPVFVEPEGPGTTFGLDVQAAVIKSTEEFATVKFIDARDEALTEDEGTPTIRNDGVLLALGPVIGSASTAEVRCDELGGSGVVISSKTFTLTKAANAWTVVTAT